MYSMALQKTTHILAIGGKSVEDARWEDNQVVLFQADTHPLIGQTPYIKESFAIHDVPNLLVLVQVLVEEHLNFFFVHVAHLVGRDDDLVPVLVGALIGDLIDFCHGWTAVIEDTELV